MKRDHKKTLCELGRAGRYGPRYLRHWAANYWRLARQPSKIRWSLSSDPLGDSPPAEPLRAISTVLFNQLAANHMNSLARMHVSTFKSLGYPDDYNLTNCTWGWDEFSRWGHQ